MRRCPCGGQIRVQTGGWRCRHGREAWCGESEPEKDEEEIYVGEQLVMENERPQARRADIVLGRVTMEMGDWLLY